MEVARSTVKRASLLRATVGGRPARVRVINDAEVAVRVPGLEPGSADVVLRAGSRVVERSTITVRDTAARTVVLSTDGKSFRVERMFRCGDGFTHDVRSSWPRISIDLVGESGTVVFTTSVVSPTAAGGEYFTGDGTERLDMGRETTPGAAIMSIRIPVPPPGTRLRIYAAPAGADLATEGGRKQRTFLQEVALP